MGKMHTNIYCRLKMCPKLNILFQKGMVNRFKMNNKFYQIIRKIFGRHSHSCLMHNGTIIYINL